MLTPDWQGKAKTGRAVFVVASHYHSLQIVVLLLQACLLGCLALTHIVAATVEVATTGPAVSTFRESLQLFFEDSLVLQFARGKGS